MADIAVLGLRVDSTGAVVATQKLADELNKLGQRAEGTERSLGALVGRMASFVAVGAALRKAVADAQAFEAQIALVSTVTDNATASMTVFSRQVLDTFRDLPVKSTAELTKGLYDIISAGVPAGKAMEFLNVAARSAIAGVTDTATAVDALTSVVNAYATTQLDVNVASDQFFKAIQLGKTTFGELAASIGKAAPVAAAFGVDLADVLAATARLTAGGINTAESITGIRSAIVSIIQPTEEFKKQFPALAKEFDSTKLKAVGFVNFLKEFAEASGNSEEAINALFSDIRGKTAVLSLLTDGGVKAADALDQIRNASGASSDAFDKATATSAALTQQLRNQLSAAFIEIGTKSLPAVNVVLTTLVQGMQLLASNLPVVAAALAGAAAAAAAYAVQARLVAVAQAVMSSGGVITGLLNVVKALRSMATAATLLSAAKGSIAGVLAAVGGLAAGYVAYNAVQKKLAEDEAKYNAELERTLAAQQALANVPAPVTAASGTPVKAVDEEAVKKAQAVRDAAADRVRLAQQALELEGMIGREADLQVVRNKAVNDLTEARRELQGELLALTEAAVAEELRLAESTVLQRRARELAQANADRVRAAADLVELAGLEGVELARVRAQQQAAAAVLQARRTLTGQELEDREAAVAEELRLTLQAIETNDQLEKRKELAKEAAQAAKKAAKEQERLAQAFADQFQRTLSGGIERVLRSGLDGFRDFTQTLKDLFLKVFADILAANVFKRLTAALGAALPTGVAGAQTPGAGLPGIGSMTTTPLMQYGGAALGGLAVGYGVGSMTTNRTLGAVGGAATGALMGAQVAGPVGAIVGGVAGLVGGLLGSAAKAKEAAEKMRQAREAFEANLQAFVDKAAGTDTPLKAALRDIEEQRKALVEQAKAVLPKGTKVTGDPEGVLKVYDQLAASGNRLLQAAAKNLAPYVEKLREINAAAAELRRQAEAEFAQQQRQLQEDFRVRELRAQGNTAEADALQFAQQQQREYAAAVKASADATTLAALAAAQLAERQKFAADQQRRAEEEAKAAAQAQEDQRRRVRALELDTQAFTDPRGAERARDVEDAANRIFDAIARGASEAELAALRLYNAALLAAREAERLEQDRRTSEGLVVRGLAASGERRAAEDAQLASRQRQELADAVRSGMTETNVALLQFVQFAEREALATQRAIEDGTKAINAAAADELKATELLIEVTRSAAAAQVAAINAQIEAVQAGLAVQVKGFDAQISAIKEETKLRLKALDEQTRAARDQLQVSQQQLQALEKSVQVSTQVVAALDDFSNSLQLGTFSPLSPEDQLAEARRQFDQLAQAAQGGDAAAAQQLPQAANALLAASRAFNASNSGFVEDFNRVQDVVAAVREQFAATLPVDQQQLEQLRRSVEGQQQALKALDLQREAITEAANRQVEVLEKAKAEAQENARRLVDTLKEERTRITADAEATVAKLQETKEAIRESADRAIEQLIADENAKLATRLRENEFYDLFKTYAAGAGEYYQRALQELERPGEGGAGGAAPGTPGGQPTAGAQLQDALQATVAELREVNRTLQERLGVLQERVERLTLVAAKGTEAEVDATYRVVEAVNRVAVEVRSGAQLSAARGGGGVGIGISGR